MVAEASLVGPLTTGRVDEEHRVEWSIGGSTVWFSSTDVTLRPTGDAALSAFLLPVANRHLPIEIADPVDAELVAQVPDIAEIAHEWWDLEVQPPNVRTVAPGSPAGLPAPGTAMFFTGGVDSFYSLLTSERVPSALVFVVGFDVPLHDAARIADAEAHVRAVADAVGSRAIVVRTNLREVPLFEELGWPTTHGGALAAVGHLLGDSVGTVVIASSFPEPWAGAWGSHWQMDHLWSSSRVQFEHHGGKATRIDKVRAIGASPLVRDHLQVCWQRATEVGNCGVCAKCLATGLFFDLAGYPEGRRQVPVVPDLLPTLAALSRTSFVTSYLQLLDEGMLPDDLVPAVTALLERTGHLLPDGSVSPSSPLVSGRPWGLA